MKPQFYILNAAGEPVAEPDTMKWAAWFLDDSQRQRIPKTQVGDYFISTAFLGVDHAMDEGTPILWETAAFDKNGHWHDKRLNRCAGTREQALAMHEEMVAEYKLKYGNK